MLFRSAENLKAPAAIQATLSILINPHTEGQFEVRKAHGAVVWVQSHSHEHWSMFTLEDGSIPQGTSSAEIVMLHKM